MTGDGLVLYSGTVIAASSFQERVDAAVAGGFSSLSLFPHDYLGARAAGLTDTDMRSSLAAAGVGVTVLDPVTTWLPGSVPPPGTDASLLAFAQHSAEDIFAMATAVGATTVNALEFWGRQVDTDAAGRAFRRLCDDARQHGLRVHLEAMPFSGIPSLSTAWDIVRRADRDNGGLLVDSWHWFRGENSLEDLAAVPGDRIFAVQLSDGPALPAPDISVESMQSRLLPGEGDWPLLEWLRAVERTGAEPTWGPEVFSSVLRGDPPAAVARRAGDATRAVLSAAGLPAAPGAAS